MGRVRSLLFMDAGAALDKAVLPYLRMWERHPALMRLVALLVVGASAVLWYREGLGDLVMVVVIALVVAIGVAVVLGLPYVALRAAIARRKRRPRL